jgi:hypothetical protein
MEVNTCTLKKNAPQTKIRRLWWLRNRSFPSILPSRAANCLELLILNNLAAGVDRPALPTNLSNAA